MGRGYLASVLLVFCLSGSASAQTLRAITQDGKLVILNPNGTWRYADETSQKQDIPTGIIKRTPVELTRGSYVLLLDETKWRVTKKQNEADRQVFNHVKGDAWATAITERVPIPLSNLKKLALGNAQEAAPDAKVTLDEMRRVNGLEVLCLKIMGTSQGIPFIYYGYYHSNAKGTVQLITYTASNLFDEYQEDFTELLGGLTLK